MLSILGFLYFAMFKVYRHLQKLSNKLILPKHNVVTLTVLVPSWISIFLSIGETTIVSENYVVYLFNFFAFTRTAQLCIETNLQPTLCVCICVYRITYLLSPIMKRIFLQNNIRFVKFCEILEVCFSNKYTELIYCYARKIYHL